VRELSLVCGLSPVPVPYDSIDGEPVRLFFLIVGPESSAGQHIKVLSRIARLVRRDHLRQRLCEARTPEQFYATLLDAEASA
jgi:mannitol/fructose-specific phosphotransferase system IIA component (Ntr-type)